MICAGFWLDDARGALLVISFDDRRDITLLRAALNQSWRDGRSLNLSTSIPSQMFNLAEISFHESNKLFARQNAQNYDIYLDSASIDALNAKLDTMIASGSPGHNYIDLNSQFELLLTHGEYSEHHFS